MNKPTILFTLPFIGGAVAQRGNG